MLGLGPLVLVALVVAVVLSARRHRAWPSAPPDGGRAVAPASITLDERLAGWVAAGLVDGEQAERIRAWEAARPVARPRPARGSRVPAVGEALGYLGGMLAVLGLVLVVARSWSDASTAARLVLSASAALGLFAAGALVHEAADAALARLRWFLWLGSTAAAAVLAGVVAVDLVGADSPATVTLACALAAAGESLALWRLRDRPVQQATALGGIAVAAGAAAAALFGTPGAAGPALWAVGAAWVAAGYGHRTLRPLLTEGIGAAFLFAGAAFVAGTWPGIGLPFVVVTAFGLLALSFVPPLARTRGEEAVFGAVGAVALFEGALSAVGYFASHAGGPTGVAVWAVGIGLLVVGDRRLVRVPLAAELLGALAVLGGPAVTAAQWPDLAPAFGIATALGLVASGMRPGRVPFSVFGSLGLLVYVPWAIGRYFPGEGRVPLLLLVSGCLILAMAVVLTRFAERPGRRNGPRAA
ncbi:MAG TPA: DUF2157 domain-containing protein [Acidimicrobiales bacterium]|nr:DUF2157 domain-containing protein [Acidimicrobiales bacterium]